MTTATRNEVCRLVPGLQDHTVLEVLAMEPSVGELEAALQLLRGDDEGLIEVQEQQGTRLNRLIGILASSGVRQPDQYDER